VVAGTDSKQQSQRLRSLGPRLITNKGRLVHPLVHRQSFMAFIIYHCYMLLRSSLPSRTLILSKNEKSGKVVYCQA
jgi:hypothetical protein